jgi:peptide/nickel transport system substrate-binding protein
MIAASSEPGVLGLTGFGLFSFDCGLEPFAAADSALSRQTSADGMIDKVVVREELLWSDSRPITAHDMAFSFMSIMDSRAPIATTSFQCLATPMFAFVASATARGVEKK